MEDNSNRRPIKDACVNPNRPESERVIRRIGIKRGMPTRTKPKEPESEKQRKNADEKSVERSKC